MILPSVGFLRLVSRRLFRYLQGIPLFESRWLVWLSGTIIIILCRRFNAIITKDYNYCFASADHVFFHALKVTQITANLPGRIINGRGGRPEPFVTLHVSILSLPYVFWCNAIKNIIIVLLISFFSYFGNFAVNKTYLFLGLQFFFLFNLSMT